MLNCLNEVCTAAGIAKPLNVKDIISFGDVFITKENDEEVLAKKWRLVISATKNALSNLMDMKTQEGNQLKKDLLDRIQAIDSALDNIIVISDNRGDDVRRN